MVDLGVVDRLGPWQLWSLRTGLHLSVRAFLGICPVKFSEGWTTTSLYHQFGLWPQYFSGWR